MRLSATAAPRCDDAAFRAGRVGPRAPARWRAAVLVSGFAALAGGGCSGRAGTESLICADADAGARSSDAGDDVACSPAACSIFGGWQYGGGEFSCTAEGACMQVIPRCTRGAIRFEPSGALLRLTSAGWESACGYATCGDRVTGDQLSNLLTAAYPSANGSPCGPAWDVFIVASSIAGDASSLTTCALHAYAPCGSGPMDTEGPPGVSPWSVQLAYSPCAP